MTSSFLASIHSFNFRPARYWEYTMYSQYMGGLKWNPPKMMMTALKYEMSLRSTHLSDRRMLRTWGSWKLHWRRLIRRERFSWKKEDNHFGGLTWKISKGDKIVRDAITDQFCIFLTLIKKTVTTEVDKIRRRSVQTDKYTLKSRQFHSYNN